MRSFRYNADKTICTAADYRAEQVTVYRASIEVYTPIPEGDDMAGGSFVEYLACEHNHLTPEAAQGCADGIASRARRGRE